MDEIISVSNQQNLRSKKLRFTSGTFTQAIVAFLLFQQDILLAADVKAHD